MENLRLSAGALLLSVLACLPAFAGAQGLASAAVPVAPMGAGFEVSPCMGMMGGSGLLGLRASMNYNPLSLELGGEQVMGRAATLYPFTLNLVLDLAQASRTRPFAIVGGGLLLTVPSNSVGEQTVSSMGINFGGGLRYYLNRRLGIRFETKQLFTRVANRIAW